MRYKEFNRNRVLEDCIKLFWDGGYHATPISKIVDKTNVNRSSLYDEFTDKKGVLLASLDLYIERYINPRLALLSSSQSISEDFYSFLSSYLDQQNQKHPKGCYLIHLSSELGESIEEVQSKLDEYLASIQNKVKGLLNAYDVDYQNNISTRLTGLFCSSMCFCLIKDEKSQEKFIKNTLKLIFQDATKA